MRVFVGKVEQVAEFARDRDLAGVALDLGQPRLRCAEGLLKRRDIAPSAGDQAADATFRLVKQGGQQVSRLDVRIVVANRAALGLG